MTGFKICALRADKSTSARDKRSLMLLEAAKIQKQQKKTLWLQVRQRATYILVVINFFQLCG